MKKPTDMKAFYAIVTVAGIFAATISSPAASMPGNTAGASTASVSAADDGWTVRAEVRADGDRYGDYYGVTLGAGGIGIMPWKTPLSIEQVILGNVFDENSEGLSLAVLGINPFKLSVKADGQDVWADTMTQTLDMRRAAHTTSLETDKIAMSYTVRALRNMPYGGMIDVTIKALRDVELEIGSGFDVPGKQYVDEFPEWHDHYVNGQTFTVCRLSARTVKRGFYVSASNALITREGGNRSGKCSLKAGETTSFTLIGAVVSSRDFIDPFNESDRQIIFAVKEGVDRLVERHEKAWEDMWKGDIIIEGDPLAQKTVRMALYHLYSFARENSRQSIPPFGLSAQGYYGHIFWDTEIWMYPPMLFLNGGIAGSMMDYRLDCLDAARKKAYSYGYRGAMFPWESDGAGEESCPLWAYTGPLEHHITADIGIAAWNYYRMSRDKEWLRDKGWPLLKSVADFWVSRVDVNDDGSYSVRNVVGADEYAEGVNDNAFTNGAAIAALRAATKAAKVLGIKPDDRWDKVASGIRIIKNGDGVTMEYEGYDGRVVKQADVNLLAYPLGIVSKRADVLKDLQYYEDRLDPHGPAMSFSILALQYARLGNGEKAYELFKRSYDANRLPPFDVLAECAGAVNPYFTTGAGGMLQCVINGFGGLDLTDNGVRQVKSALPPHWKSLTITGVGPEGKTWKVVNR